MAKEQGLSLGMINPVESMIENYITKEAPVSYELGDFDQTLFLYLDGQQQRDKETLNIFPWEPLHVEPSTKFGMSLSAPPQIKRAPKNSHNQGNSNKPIKNEGATKAAASSSDHEGPKTPDAKTLRRLAQNREAARKSRLRKKAYVQQLESCKMKLNQLEQEMHWTRTQGVMFHGASSQEEQAFHSSSNVAAMFDLEYARWLEEHRRHMMGLRAAVQEDQLPQNELLGFVGNFLAHYVSLMNLKGTAIKANVFHILSGMWKTPAERCFLWIGGFCPSQVIKVGLRHISEPLGEPQIVGISKLQHTARETEGALSQGLEALHGSLADIIVFNMANYMGQMATAMANLSALEGFALQADNLRLETLHRLCEILTPRQSAMCFLAISEYFHHLRALSSLWLSRPKTS